MYKRQGDSREATYRLLDHFDYLGVRGGGIKINGELIAFSIGEPLTDNTALIHIEFGDPTIRGAFNIINQQFCEHAWSAYQYVNREEDMGLPGSVSYTHLNVILIWIRIISQLNPGWRATRF